MERRPSSRPSANVPRTFAFRWFKPSRYPLHKKVPTHSVRSFFMRKNYQTEQNQSKNYKKYICAVSFALIYFLSAGFSSCKQHRKSSQYPMPSEKSGLPFSHSTGAPISSLMQYQQKSQTGSHTGSLQEYIIIHLAMRTQSNSESFCEQAHASLFSQQDSDFL